MSKIVDYIVERAKEKSTVISVVTIVSGGVGLTLLPEQSEAISAVIMAILTAVGVFTKEAK